MAVVAQQSDDTLKVPTFAEAETAGEVLARFVAALEPRRYSGEDAVALVRMFTNVERTGVAGKTLAACRVDESRVHSRSGSRSAAEFIAATTGDSVGETKDLIRLGEQLDDQPELADAFRKQKISRRRASQVSKAAKVNPNRERDLVEGAQRDSDASFKERCQRAKAEGRSHEEAERHRRALHANRYCRTYTDDDGAFRIDALFGPEAGAHVLAALDAQADRQFEQARKDGRCDPPAAYRADALLALLTGKGILGPQSKHKQGSGAARSGGNLGATTGQAADVADCGTGRAPDPRATVFVTADLEALRRGNVGVGERCEIPGVGPVSVEHVRDLLGEALVELIIAKGTDVTTVYSAGRHIPKRVQSALLLRDPRCVVPGCDARLGLENDHWVTDFAKGGLTALDNLARVCRGHHRDRTHHGFELRKQGGTWIWIAPEHPVIPKRPKRSKRSERSEPKRKPGDGGRTKAPPPDTNPPLFDNVSPPRRE